MLDTLSRRPAAGAARQALREYRTVSLEARVASASPHALVLMLFERLLFSFREAQAAATAGDAARRLRATERALALVDGLDATLDDARGGEVAQSLHAVYALLHNRLGDGSAEALGEAVLAVEALTDAWRQITPAPSRQTGADRV
jgi:flagellar protein FliS